MCTCTCTQHCRGAIVNSFCKAFLVPTGRVRKASTCRKNPLEYGTEQKPCARALTCHIADGACQSSPRTGLRRCNTYTEQNNAHHKAYRCDRQRLTLSVFVVRKFRTDSVCIVQDTRETNTSLDLTQTDNGKNIDTDRNEYKLYLVGGITFHVHTSRYQETSYQNKHSRSQHGPRRSYYHKSFIDGRSRDVLYTACRMQTNVFRLLR